MNTFWRDRPVFVTGATGFLGGWLARRLVEAGADVTCLARDWVPQSELARGGLAGRVRVARGDVRDQALLERVLGENEIDTVFHLAAQTIVTIANRNPVSTFETNVGGAWSLLEACRRSPLVRQVVVASSDKAYGECERLPCDEESPLRARHPYDVSKACGDLIAAAYATTYGLPVVVTRCGNLYGGGDLNWNRIVPGTARSALRGEKVVVRSNGAPARDYFYVGDAAAAYMLLAERLAEDASLRGEAFNFSNEEPVTVLELVRRILLLSGSEVEVEVHGGAPNEIALQHLSAEKARRRLNWGPLFTLDEGLGRAVEWYRSFLSGGSS